MEVRSTCHTVAVVATVAEGRDKVVAKDAALIGAGARRINNTGQGLEEVLSLSTSK